MKGKVDVPFVTTIHSDYRLDFKDNFYKKLVYTTLNTLSLRRFDYYIGVSDTFKKLLLDRGFQRDKIFVTYNGIDIEKEEKFKSRKEFLQKYGIEDKSQPIIGILARLDKVKDHKTFILAAKKVLKKRKATFLIGGDGADLQELKELVKREGIDKSVHFLGFIKEPFSFINAIDINALSSLSESFPYVILEGAKLKKPIVTTDVGGIHKLIRQGENGFLVPVGDSDAFANKLLELLNDEDRRASMGEQLYKDVAKSYSYKSMAKAHISIYKAILSKGDRLLMSGYFGFDNSGDDAILKAIVKDLREYREDVRIKVLSKDPDKTELLCDVVSTDRFKLRDVNRGLRQTDLLISGGGSLLQDVTSTRSLLYYLAVMQLSRFHKKPFMVYANGIGPINKPINRRLTKYILNKAALITLRDKDSLEYIKNMGVKNPNTFVTADPVFTLEAVDEKRVETILKNEAIPEDKPLIGVSVRSWKDDNKLIENVSKAIEYIIEAWGVNVVLVAMHYPEDLNISRAIKSRVSNSACYVLEDKYSVEELMGVISKMELILAMRLHSLIYAATRETPMVGLVYDPKVKGFLEELGLEYYLDVDKITYESLVNTLEYAWNDLSKMKAKIAVKDEELRELALLNVVKAFALVDRRKYEKS